MVSSTNKTDCHNITEILFIESGVKHHNPISWNIAKQKSLWKVQKTTCHTDAAKIIVTLQIVCVIVFLVASELFSVYIMARVSECLLFDTK